MNKKKPTKTSSSSVLYEQVAMSIVRDVDFLARSLSEEGVRLWCRIFSNAALSIQCSHDAIWLRFDWRCIWSPTYVADSFSNMKELMSRFSFPWQQHNF